MNNKVHTPVVVELPISQYGQYSEYTLSNSKNFLKKSNISVTNIFSPPLFNIERRTNGTKGFQ